MDPTAHTQKTFNSLASVYDRSYIVRHFQRPIQRLTIQQLKIKKGMTILDVGCGTGSGLIDIADMLEGSGRLVGIDISQEMVREAQKKISTSKYQNIEVVQGTVFDLQDITFDAIVTSNAFHHFEDQAATIAQMYTLLNTGGTLVLEEFCNDYILTKCMDITYKLLEIGHIGSMTSSKLVHLFENAGFENMHLQKKLINKLLGIMIVQGYKT